MREELEETKANAEETAVLSMKRNSSQQEDLSNEHNNAILAKKECTKCKETLSKLVGRLYNLENDGCFGNQGTLISILSSLIGVSGAQKLLATANMDTGDANLALGTYLIERKLYFARHNTPFTLATIHCELTISVPSQRIHFR